MNTANTTKTTNKIVYLMRGLPCCGKSHKAKRLAGNDGVVLETDQYFHTEVGTDPAKYDYDKDKMSDARAWNYNRFVEAVNSGKSPIVVDRGNSLNEESQRYALYAIKHGYKVELAEPDSPWWQEIRVLLKYKRYMLYVLYEWAERLSKKSHQEPPHHRVGSGFIRNLIDKWRHDVTIDDIINYKQGKDKKRQSKSK